MRRVWGHLELGKDFRVGLRIAKEPIALGGQNLLVVGQNIKFRRLKNTLGPIACFAGPVDVHAEDMSAEKVKDMDAKAA